MRVSDYSVSVPIVPCELVRRLHTVVVWRHSESSWFAYVVHVLFL